MGFVKYKYGGVAHRFELPPPISPGNIAAASTQRLGSLRATLQLQCGRHVTRIYYRDQDDIDFDIGCDMELAAAQRYAALHEPGGELRLFIDVGGKLPPKLAHRPQSEAGAKPHPHPHTPAERHSSMHVHQKLREQKAIAAKRERERMHVAAEQRQRAAEKSVRFDVHDYVTCDRCKAEPIVGVRHWCVDIPSLDLCTACRSASREYDGLRWRKVPYAWLKDDARHTAPAAPLWKGVFSDDVKLLQRCLLRLGYLRADDLNKLVGYYQQATANAVRRFRADYNVPEDDDFDNDVFTQQTADVLAKVADL